MGPATFGIKMFLITTTLGAIAQISANTTIPLPPLVSPTRRRLRLLAAPISPTGLSKPSSSSSALANHAHRHRSMRYWEQPLPTDLGLRQTGLGQLHNYSVIRPILYLHFHKAGGTAACFRLAKAWGLRTLIQGTGSFSNNCNDNINGDGPFRPAIPTYGESCETRAEYMRSHSIDFAAIESFLAHEPCSAMTYMTSMRPPIDRVLSHMIANHINVTTALDTFQHALPNISMQETSVNIALPAEGTALWPPSLLSNFYTRTLLSPDEFYLPIRMLNGTHYSVAKRRLEKFHLIIPMDQCTFETSVLIAATLKWSLIPIMFNAAGGLRKLIWGKHSCKCGGLVRKTDAIYRNINETLLAHQNVSQQIVHEIVSRVPLCRLPNRVRHDTLFHSVSPKLKETWKLKFGMTESQLVAFIQVLRKYNRYDEALYAHAMRLWRNNVRDI